MNPNAILLTLLLSAALPAGAAEASAASLLQSACAASAPTYDTREVQCKLPKNLLVRRLRFKANFSGGHDDTMARLEPFIDNTPLKCDEASKTSLSAEDGDVSLWCTFSLTDQVKDGGAFKFSIRWSHADYVDFELAEH